MSRFLLFIIVFLIHCASIAQDNSKKQQRAELKAKVAATVDSLVSSRSLVFVANTALPLGGGHIRTGANYEMVLRNDSLAVFLPYFGRAYQVDVLNSEGGIKFSSLVDKYISTFKKGNHIISFEAKAPNDHYRFVLNISQSGYATLFVASNNRQSISFEGVVE